MSRRRKGPRIVGRFLALPHSVLQSEQFKRLTNASVRLLLLIAMQYTGDNNGKLVCCAKFLEKHGRASRGSLDRGIKELLASGLISRTRFGNRRLPAWYAIGWRECDVPPGSHGVQSGDFQRFEPEAAPMPESAHFGHTATVSKKVSFDTATVEQAQVMTPPRCQLTAIPEKL